MLEKQVTISILARLLQTTQHTIRHYEAVGLLEPATIATNGYRQYGMAQAYQLSFILFLRQLDLSLAEIKQLLTEDQVTDELLLTKKAAVHAEIKRLQQLEQVLDAQLSGRQTRRQSVLILSQPVYLRSVKRLPINQDLDLAVIATIDWNSDFMLREIYYVITADYYDICLTSVAPTDIMLAPATYSLTTIKAASGAEFDQQLAPILEQQSTVIALENRSGFLAAGTNLVIQVLNNAQLIKTEEKQI